MRSLEEKIRTCLIDDTQLDWEAEWRREIIKEVLNFCDEYFVMDQLAKDLIHERMADVMSEWNVWETYKFQLREKEE